MTSFARMSVARLAVIGLSGTVLIAAVLLAGTLIGQRAFAPLEGLDGEPRARTEAATPTPASEEAPAVEDFVAYQDDEGGFAIRYPQGWERHSPDDEQVRLLVTPNDRDSIMVRVAPLELDEIDEEVTEEDLAALHGFTEQIVREDEGVEVLLGPEPVEIAGTVGSYYLYTFEDGTGPGRGVHAHYFLFEPDRMITLIFQTIPPERFRELADVFDVVADSFELTE